MLRALVFADRLGEELMPLTEGLSVPLLPVVGKEVLIYAIEELAAAGCRELTLVAAAHGEQLGATSLGDGARWGIRIRYVLSSGEERPSAVRRRLSLPEGEALLVLRGDLLRGPGVRAFLDWSQSETGSVFVCTSGDPRGSLLLLRRGAADSEACLDILDWRRPEAIGDVARACPVAFPCYALQDLAAFHRANLDLVGGRIPGLAPGGRIVALGLLADRRAQVSPRSLKQGVAYVGPYARVHPEAELLGEVVVGADVILDRAATVRDSVVLPRTYVGELLDIGNAIVAGNWLLRVDTGARLKLSEAFLLGDLDAESGRGSRSVLDRFLAFLLLLASLPLWPLAAAAAALAGEGPLLDRRVLIGNRSGSSSPGRPAGGFVDWCWTTPIPVLRHLPRLLPAMRGDLRLFGVSPLTPEEDAGRTEDWQRVRDRAPVGLIGPTQLELGERASVEERLLSDAFYARDPAPGAKLRLLARALTMLLGVEAWRAPETRTAD